VCAEHRKQSIKPLNFLFWTHHARGDTRTGWKNLGRYQAMGNVNRVPPRSQSRPSLGEVAQARPRRSAGAPARSRSHYDAILELLRERGSQGVLGSELYSHSELYGRSPRNRISEARRDGHLIEGKPYGTADWFYRLIWDNDGAEPEATSPQKPEPPFGESPYMRSRRLEEEAALPLFAAGART